MPSFQQRIHAIVPEANAKHVEALMRDVGNLDLLGPEDFERLCWSCVPQAKADPQKAEALAYKMRLRNEEV